MLLGSMAFWRWWRSVAAAVPTAIMEGLSSLQRVVFAIAQSSCLMLSMSMMLSMILCRTLCGSVLPRMWMDTGQCVDGNMQV